MGQVCRHACLAGKHRQLMLLCIAQGLLPIGFSNIPPSHALCPASCSSCQPNCPLLGLVQIKGTGNGTDQIAFAAVAAGRYHSVALDRQGRVYTWGLNDFGQLGRPAASASTKVNLALRSLRAVSSASLSKACEAVIPQGACAQPAKLTAARLVSCAFMSAISLCRSSCASTLL